MKSNKCLFLLILLLTNLSFQALAQGDKEEVVYFADLKKYISLIADGKFGELMIIEQNKADSLRSLAEKYPKKKQDYWNQLINQAMLYENIGDFSKAEQLIKQVITENPVTKDIDYEYGRKVNLNRLALLYEKWGKDEENEKALEELVISEYWSNATDKKTALHNYVLTMVTMNDAMQKKQLLESYNELSKKNDSVSISSMKDIRERMDTKLDTLAMVKVYEDIYTRPDSSNAAGIAMMTNMAMMIGTILQASKPPTAGQLKLLREGKLKLGDKRNGLNFNDPWSELQRLCQLYRKRKNYSAAEALIKQAIALDDNPKEGGQATYMNNFLKAVMPNLTGMDSMFKSRQLASMAKQVFTVNNKYGGTDIFYVRNKVLLAQIYNDEEKHAEYKLLADTIYTLCKKLDTVANSFIINPLADAYTQIGKNEEALQAYQKIINYYKGITGNVYINYPDYLNALQQTARLYEINNQLQQAEEYCSVYLDEILNGLRSNFDYLSEREKIAMLNNEVSAFSFSASLLLNQSNPSNKFKLQVFNQQLRIKSLVLNDEERIFQDIRKSSDPQLQKLMVNWYFNKAFLAKQYSLPANKRIPAVDSLENITNNEEKKLNVQSAAFRINASNHEISFKQVQQKLNAGEAAIEFVRFNYFDKNWTDSVMYAAFVIRSDNVVPYFIPLCEENQLIKLLIPHAETNLHSSEFVNNLYNGYKDQNDNNNGKLWKLIWQPILPFLKGITKLDIAPVGILNNISFNALSENNKNYLIDQYQEVRQYLSTRDIATTKMFNEKNETDAVLYGGIRYGIADDKTSNNESPQAIRKVWPSLSTLDEVDDIDKIFKANNKNSILITGSAATEESLKGLSGHSPHIMHIATHGFSNPATDTLALKLLKKQEGNQFTGADNAMLRNGIVMANANKVWSGGLPVEGKDDGIVTAYEIANLDLSNTELVVLSACETALGDVKGTEGIFGLQRAFKLAGVQNMLLSLWDLPDQETTQFMSSFYNNKIQKNMPDYQALKMTQDEFRKNKKTPYYWAGFVLIE